MLLWNVPTRWLSLRPAVSRLHASWPEGKAYVLSLGEKRCPKVLWKLLEVINTVMGSLWSYRSTCPSSIMLFCCWREMIGLSVNYMTSSTRLRPSSSSNRWSNFWSFQTVKQQPLHRTSISMKSATLRVLRPLRQQLSQTCGGLKTEE